jgi:hypothetical protein
MIDIQNLHFAYRKKKIFTGLSLQLQGKAGKDLFFLVRKMQILNGNHTECFSVLLK